MPEQLQIGQSLTPSQVRDLPDGAECTLLDHAGKGHKWCVASNYVPRKFVAHDLERRNIWIRATLVSLPSIEPKANDNLISEKLAQSPETAEEPSPGEGYRWLVPGVDELSRGDARRSTIDRDKWIGTIAYGEPFGPNCYRRRIEPQAVGIDYGGPDKTAVFVVEPKPKASEIEKECAVRSLSALMDECHSAMVAAQDSNGYVYMDNSINVMLKVFADYKRVYDYARSIGAIE